MENGNGLTAEKMDTFEKQIKLPFVVGRTIWCHDPLAIDGKTTLIVPADSYGNTDIAQRSDRRYEPGDTIYLDATVTIAVFGKGDAQ
jgi:hypothetical protein